MSLHPDVAEALTHSAHVKQALEATSRILARAGLAPVATVEPRILLGRNNSWVMTLKDGQRVFVKHIDAEKAGSQALTRSVAFASFAANNHDSAPPSPELLGRDETSGYLIFEECRGDTAATLMAREQLPIQFARTVGQQLARLHSASASNLPLAAPPSPPTTLLSVGIPHTRFFDFSIAEIALWSQLQHDTELVKATIRLREEELLHASSPTHNDLRLDQFLVDDLHTYLLDWEEFGAGDPARDLGTLAGEFMYRAILDTVTTRGAGAVPPPSFDTASASAYIGARIVEFVPVVHALWSSYCETAQTSDESLAARSTAHLGWHLVERTVARASSVSRLPGIERAAAGIGRKALLEPDRFALSLGFSGGA